MSGAVNDKKGRIFKRFFRRLNDLKDKKGRNKKNKLPDPADPADPPEMESPPAGRSQGTMRTLSG